MASALLSPANLCQAAGESSPLLESDTLRPAEPNGAETAHKMIFYFSFIEV